jgi:tRNA A37 threonylcarbamoyladenosine biosynthesis protein TsaE
MLVGSGTALVRTLKRAGQVTGIVQNPTYTILGMVH